MITIHIPKGTKTLNMKNELMSARNIKDRQIRNITITGLNKIAHYL